MEADGPSPCHNSMISLGVCALKKDKQILIKWEWKFYPLQGKVRDTHTMNGFWAKNKEGWDYSNEKQQDALRAFRTWGAELNELKKAYTLLPLASPAAYDWQWINYYFAEAGCCVDR